MSTLIAEEAYAALEPITGPDEANGFPLRALMRAIGTMFAQSEEAVRAIGDGHDAWERVWNPDLAPAWLLPFVGQAVGVVVDTSKTVAEQRAQIKALGAFKRGRPASVVAAIAATLTGTKGVRVVERNSTAWTALFVTRPTETPSLAAAQAAARTQKPGGMLFTVEESELPLVDEMSREIDKMTEATIDTMTLAQST